MKKYELIKEKYIEEVASNVKLLKHIKSGARILLFENNDENKVFSVGFRTPPTDDTGVPHILEHSTLCGSKKFPVKDPFIELLKGSLNTFLNAMTYPDKTVYPVASCNDKDFANLMEVYMDAVFYPNVYLHEEIFKQEGWHYELENVDADIIYNGVVYNEMKGAFSSPEQVVMRESRHALFPDTTYGVESGGDPEFIPNLTYEAFKNFHHRFYSPANSYIIMYGNMNMEEKLNWLDEEYLSKFDVIKVDSHIDYQKPFTTPIHEEIFYPVGKDESLENKTYYSYNAVIGTYEDAKLNLAFQILNYALLEAPGAPLKQAIIDAGIGSDILSDFDSGLLQPVLSIIVKDAQSGKEQVLDEVINKTLKELVTKGIDKKSIQAAINYYEFKYREADFGGAPKGLVYGLNAMETWLYDDNDPFTKLEYNAQFSSLKEELNTNYYEELINKYLLNNNHVAYVTVSPSNTLGAEKEQALKEKLAAYKASLTKEELEKLVNDTKALKEYQATPSTLEELATIPLLTREDIDDKVEPLYNEEQVLDGVKVLKHNVETNGIGYLNFCFNTKDVPNELIPYVGLLQNVLGYVDTTKYTYQNLTQEININTGGINPRTKIISIGDNDVLPLFVFETKALYDKIPFVFDTVKEIITSSKLNNKRRLMEILGENKSQRQMMLMGRGHVTSMNRAFSYIRSSSYYNELVDGISEYQFIEDLCLNFETKYEEIITNLEKVIKLIFRKENLIISYTATNNAYDKYLTDFVNSLYKEEVQKGKFEFTPNLLNEGFRTPSTVQYVARVGNFKEVGNYTGAFQVFAMALRYDYLWMQVRVLGGAYGCMSNFTRNGNVYFVSYRDPNLEKTMDVYMNIPNYIDSFNPSTDDLTKYIIGAIGMLDTPLSPKDKGARSFLAYLQNVTYEDLKQERHEVLNVTLDDIKALKPLIEKALNDNALCVIGNENKIEDSKIFKEKKNLFK
ncbi:MAG: insulinase family protein [Mollicutes bacterium]|nr:insulinase family protein [Mollicutes bacterium]